MLDTESKESTKLEIIMSWSSASKLSKKMSSTGVLHLLIKCEGQYEGIFRYAKVSNMPLSCSLSHYQTMEKSKRECGIQGKKNPIQEEGKKNSQGGGKGTLGLGCKHVWWRRLRGWRYVFEKIKFLEYLKWLV